VRLQKLLAAAGVASRRRAEELIAAGAVTVDGKVITTLGVQVKERRDRVEVNGRRVHVEDPLYRLLLKPRGCLATLTRPNPDKSAPRENVARPTLARYVPDASWAGTWWAPLDFLAEGVILPDHRRRSGRTHVAWRRARAHDLPPEISGHDGRIRAGASCSRGWRFNSAPVRPIKVEALATTGKNMWIDNGGAREPAARASRPRAKPSGTSC